MTRTGGPASTVREISPPTRNRAAITLLDLELAPGATFVQELPRSYNGFLYVIDGELAVGGTSVAAGQVGWIERPSGVAEGDASSTLTITGNAAGARAVLYTGQPQHEALVHHGPFVARALPPVPCGGLSADERDRARGRIPMSLSMAPLLMHSSDLSLPVRQALQAAHAADPDEREDRLAEAAELLFQETQLECADVRELVGLAPGGC